MDVSTYFNFVAALALVLCLIGILAWIAKRLGLGSRLTATAQGGSRRLGVEEVKPLDFAASWSCCAATTVNT